MFGAISIFMYVSLYTPLKTLTPLSVFVGAFPGAIPFMLGWVAATGNFGIEAGTLFLIQFFWQFPHFIAIAWVLNDEYKKAYIGFYKKLIKLMVAYQRESTINDVFREEIDYNNWYC